MYSTDFRSYNHFKIIKPTKYYKPYKIGVHLSLEISQKLMSLTSLNVLRIEDVVYLLMQFQGCAVRCTVFFIIYHYIFALSIVIICVDQRLLL